MYYTRVLFAVIGGVATGALNITGYTGIAVGITIYLVTYILFRNIIPAFVNIPDKKKHYMTGIFSFFLIWFVSWVLSFNLLYPVIV